MLVGVAFAYLEVRSLARQRETDVETRQAQLFMGVFQHYFDREWVRQQQEIFWQFEDYDTVDEFLEKYGPETNMEAFVTFVTRNNFYEGLGVLLKRGLIDASLIDDMLSSPIQFFWERRVQPIAGEFRERFNPAAFEWMEYLYNQIMPIRLRQHPELKERPVPFK